MKSTPCQTSTEKLQEEAHRGIQDLIMRNHLLPGQRLSIDELATDLVALALGDDVDVMNALQEKAKVAFEESEAEKYCVSPLPSTAFTTISGSSTPQILH